MNPVLIKNILRFIGILLIQTLVLARVDLSIGSFAFIHLIIYPYVIFLLPFKTSRVLLLLLSLIVGLFIDMFYNSPGVHASAMVLSGYLRGYVLDALEPYEGYNSADSPTLATMGIGWFMSYTSILLFFHLFMYFSVEAFSFVYLFDIVLNTIFSFIPSIILILLLQLLFKSKY